jgi:hypothetical protein
MLNRIRAESAVRNINICYSSQGRSCAEALPYSKISPQRLGPFDDEPGRGIQGIVAGRSDDERQAQFFAERFPARFVAIALYMILHGFDLLKAKHVWPALARAMLADGDRII